MKCPYCSHIKSRVVDSRSAGGGEAIRRRRQCQSCGERFTTFERRDIIPVKVIKMSNKKESYDRRKIEVGMEKAYQKRPVSEDTIAGQVDEIESEIRSRFDREVPAKEIGKLVMEKLRQTDEVAYMRFASVYKRFDDLKEFEQELGELKETEGSE